MNSFFFFLSELIVNRKKNYYYYYYYHHHYYQSISCCITEYQYQQQQQQPQQLEAALAVEKQQLQFVLDNKTKLKRVVFVVSIFIDHEDSIFIFGHFDTVTASGQQQQDDLIITHKASAVMECLLYCSRLTECKSAAIDKRSIGQRSRGYCQLYRAPFLVSLDTTGHFKEKEYYNKRKLL